MPTIGKSRDQGELQDMYRRALAASWAAHAAELPADQCVEDIFNGGDGFQEKQHDRHEQHSVPRFENSASDEHLNRHHHRSQSGGSSKSSSTITTKAKNFTRIGGHKRTDSRETLSPAPGIQNSHADSSENSLDRGRTGFVKANEVDEFEVRDDLVAWALPSKVTAFAA